LSIFVYQTDNKLVTLIYVHSVLKTLRKDIINTIQISGIQKKNAIFKVAVKNRHLNLYVQDELLSLKN